MGLEGYLSSFVKQPRAGARAIGVPCQFISTQQGCLLKTLESSAFFPLCMEECWAHRGQVMFL